MPQATSRSGRQEGARKKIDTGNKIQGCSGKTGNSKPIFLQSRNKNV
jgi:hypothetical protein